MVGGLTHSIMLRCEAELEHVHIDMVDCCTAPAERSVSFKGVNQALVAAAC